MSTSAERMARLRARRAAELAPAAGCPRDDGEPLADAVQVSLDALKLPPEYAAVAALARHYARAVDEAENRAMALARLGPGLLKVLVVLRAVPSARLVGRPGPARPNRVAQLRAEHARRTARRGA